MKKKKGLLKLLLVIAVVVIIVLLLVIWNLRSVRVVEDSELKDNVSYIDIGEVLGQDSDPMESDAELEELPEVEQQQDAIPPTPAEQSLNVLVVKEGDFVSFPNLLVEDPDGDEVLIEFSSPLDEDGEWQTKKGDAGNYQITISATDGEHVVTENIMIIVESVNTPPTIELSDVTVNERETVRLNPVVNDADGDAISITYVGWMTQNTKQTDYGDAGTYGVTVIASDGKDITEKTITVTVEKVNRKPVFVSIV
jgi:hypothetical protein